MTIWNECRRMVIEPGLESCRAPVDEMDIFPSFNRCDGNIYVLRGDVSPESAPVSAAGQTNKRHSSHAVHVAEPHRDTVEKHGPAP